MDKTGVPTAVMGHLHADPVVVYTLAEFVQEPTLFDSA
jgi:hypothetical protein